MFLEMFFHSCNLFVSDMSSYGSTTPPDEGFDRYEPPFYCQQTHQGILQNNTSKNFVFIHLKLR